MKAVIILTVRAALTAQAAGGQAAPTVRGTATRHGAGAVLIRGIQALPTGAATGKNGEKYGYTS